MPTPNPETNLMSDGIAKLVADRFQLANSRISHPATASQLPYLVN